MMQIYAVYWYDSMAYKGWQTKDEYLADLDKPDAMSHVTVGFLLKETDIYIALVQSTHINETQVGEAMQIPRGCVTSMIPLVCADIPVKTGETHES